MTQLIRGLNKLSERHQGAVVTIGNFDGVHVGHKRLIECLKESASQWGAPSIVMVFEPQPLEFFFPTQPASRLTRFREKFYQLAKTGADYVLRVPFNAKFAALTPEQFIVQVLYQQLKIKKLIIGEDFHFGAERKGNTALLKAAGKQYGFIVEEMQSIWIDASRASSTRIRHALAEGDLPLAERLLGRPYAMMGRVVLGNQIGRTLGFPTANIHLHRVVSPVQGIYAVRVRGIENFALLGVASVGSRPTIGGTRVLLEVYLFNFDQALYGKYVTVEFCKKFRAERHFANLDLLREQIKIDVEWAWKFFMAQGRTIS